VLVPPYRPDGRSIYWPQPDTRHTPLTPYLMWRYLMWRTILVPAVLVIGGCHVRRVDFMTRVQEDCLAGQQWACDLINSLSKPPPMENSEAPKNVGAHAE
jgi:hypothetical protein